MDQILDIEPGSKAYEEMLALRRRLLREPLGRDFTDVELATEAYQVHLAYRRDETIVGTLLLVPPDATGSVRLRQMAIETSLQRQGLGAALVRRAERDGRRLGASSVVLHARLTAVGFYRKLGYVPQGDAFLELDIPHRRMNKGLAPARP